MKRKHKKNRFGDKKTQQKPLKDTSFKKEETHKKNTDKTKSKASTPATKEVNTEIAINKYVASSGICSRRKAVELIEKGYIKINDEIATKPYTRVQPGDVVKYKDKIIKPETTKQYILLNKPKNCITSLDDPEGRKTVIDIVKNACKERIFPVGRLDRDTTGLLLITNDGDLAKKLSHPSYKIKKLYYATLDKAVSNTHIEQILKGFELEDGKVAVDACGFVDGSKGLEVGIEVHIGRNRIVRRIFEHFGYEVKKLDRVYYAGLTKKDLPRSRWRHLNAQEVIMLKHFS